MGEIPGAPPPVVGGVIVPPGAEAPAVGQVTQPGEAMQPAAPPIGIAALPSTSTSSGTLASVLLFIWLATGMRRMR